MTPIKKAPGETCENNMRVRLVERIPILSAVTGDQRPVSRHHANGAVCALRHRGIKGHHLLRLLCLPAGKFDDYPVGDPADESVHWIAFQS